MEYMDGVDGRLDGFNDFQAAKADPLLILSEGHFTHLDTVVDVDLAENKVWLTRAPEDLIFDE